MFQAAAEKKFVPVRGLENAVKGCFPILGGGRAPHLLQPSLLFALRDSRNLPAPQNEICTTTRHPACRCSPWFSSFFALAGPFFSRSILQQVGLHAAASWTPVFEPFAACPFFVSRFFVLYLAISLPHHSLFASSLVQAEATTLGLQKLLPLLLYKERKVPSALRILAFSCARWRDPFETGTSSPRMFVRAGGGSTRNPQNLAVLPKDSGRLLHEFGNSILIDESWGGRNDSTQDSSAAITAGRCKGLS